MPHVLRFYREHLKPFLLPLLGGAVLLQLAGLCQAMMIGTLKFVFQDNFNMGGSQIQGMPDFGPLVWLKGLLMSLMGEASFLRESKYLIPILLVTIMVLKGILLFSGTMIVVRCGIKATQALRKRLFASMLNQESAFFQKHPVGELIQRCVNDVGQVQGIASNQLAEAVKEIATAIAMFAMVMWMNWQLTLTIVFAVPLVVIPIQRLSRRIRKYNRRNMEASGKLLQRLKEVFSNIRVVMGFARESFEVERLSKQQHELYLVGMKSARAGALSHPIMEIVGALIMAAIIVMVSDRIAAGQYKGSDLMAYLIALFAFYDPIRRLTRLNNDLQQAQASLSRVYETMEREPLIQAPANPKAVPSEPQRISFEAVHFSYDKNSHVLRGIDLDIHRGETVALVGGSGGGKTTLVNLVPRFFDPTEGRITLDDVDVRDFDPRELRTRIGFVNQETQLFMDSIHDNIAYGKEASREAVIDAARKAHAHDFISKLPCGYDTPLAEAGTSVSGGQKQRIAIARALLQDPPILILDEATSALDTESERAVQAALETLMENRTTLVIAHRLSTIQKAHKICVLKAGQIVEMGKHEELLAQGGEYAKLHHMQFGTTNG